MRLKKIEANENQNPTSTIERTIKGHLAKYKFKEDW